MRIAKSKKKAAENAARSAPVAGKEKSSVVSGHVATESADAPQAHGQSSNSPGMELTAGGSSADGEGATAAASHNNGNTGKQSSPKALLKPGALVLHGTASDDRIIRGKISHLKRPSGSSGSKVSHGDGIGAAANRGGKRGSSIRSSVATGSSKRRKKDSASSAMPPSLPQSPSDEGAASDTNAMAAETSGRKELSATLGVAAAAAAAGYSQSLIQPPQKLKAKTKSDWTFLAVERAGQRDKPSEWDDQCTACFVGGNLVVCDTCPRAFHLACLKTLGEADGVGESGWLPPVDEKELFHCPYCRTHARSSSCVLTGLQADDTARLIPCRACPRTFHPSVAVLGTNSTAAGPQLFPNVIKAAGDGTWQCSSCSKQESDGSSSSNSSSSRSPSSIVKSAAALLAKLPPSHWGSLVGSRLEAAATLEAQYRQVCNTDSPAPGINQVADIEDVQMRFKMVLDNFSFSHGATASKIAKDAAADADAAGVGPNPSFHKTPNRAQLLRTEFFDQGFVVPAASSTYCISSERSELACALVLKQYNDNIRTVNRLGLMDQLLDTGFRTFKPRGAKRFDIQIPALDQFEEFATKAPWLPLVRAILGPEFQRMSASCVLSLPGSPGQQWHSDGDHMSDLHHLPTHCLNVFIPLCDLTPALGPTEFVPKSHIMYDVSTKHVSPCMRAGQPLLFDHRTKHRGVPNKSDIPRPLLYITYAKPWFVEQNNLGIGKNKYEELPDLLASTTRKDRASKRSK